MPCLTRTTRSWTLLALTALLCLTFDPASAQFLSTEIDVNGISPDLAAGPGGTLHAVYYDTSAGSIRHADFDGDGWSTEVAIPGGVSSTSLALAVDGSGMPHVAFRGGAGELGYATIEDSTWITEPIDVGIDLGSGLGIAIQSDGEVHVVYEEQLTGQLRHAIRDLFGSWGLFMVEPGGSRAQLRLGAADELHLIHESGASLRYGHWSGSGWTMETVPQRPSTLGTRNDVHLSVQATGAPVLAYNRSYHPQFSIDYEAHLETIERISAGFWTLPEEVDSIVSLSPTAFGLDSFATDQSRRHHFLYTRPGDGLLYALHPENGSSTEYIIGGFPFQQIQEVSMAIGWGDSPNWIEVDASTGMSARQPMWSLRSIHAGDFRGLAWGDADADGDEDLYLVADGTNVLMTNDGLGVFSESTPTPLADAGPGRAALWGDLENDGDLDLFLINEGQTNRLFRNDGGGVFADITAPPLDDASLSRAGTWVDFDLDGDLDLHVVNHSSTDRLLRNDGSGVFSDVTTPPLDDTGGGVDAAWGDYDDDGDPDLFLVKDDGADRLLRNDGGGSFSDLTAPPLGSGQAGRGAAWADFDQNGNLDLYFATGPPGTDRLYRNYGGGNFAEVFEAGLLSGGATQGLAWLDANGDGDLDLILADDAGPDHQFDRLSTFYIPNALPPLSQLQGSQAVGTADFDGDGDLDVAIAATGGMTRILRNETNPADWLEVDLVGDISNRFGVGARVTVIAGTGIYRLRRDVGSGVGGPGQASGVVHFGIPEGRDIDLVTVRWPSGITQSVAGVVSGQRLVIQERESGWFEVNDPDIANAAAGIGSAWADYDGDGDLDLYVVHYASANALLRNDGEDRFTNVTPPVLELVSSGFDAAWGDMDADGDPDLAVGTPSVVKLFRNDGGVFADITAGDLLTVGTYETLHWLDHDSDGLLDLFTLTSDRVLLFENQGAATFSEIGMTSFGIVDGIASTAWTDYDIDGDMDLYVSRRTGLDNRLYRNDGAGVFSDVAAGALLANDLWAVQSAWADVDNDGDFDLLLCEEAVPPIRGTSRLLRNDSLVFVDLGHTPFPESFVADSAAFADVDNDGDLDLLTVGFNPEGRLWRNDGGFFSDATEALLYGSGAAYPSRKGLGWGDYDGDGDLDVSCPNYIMADQLIRNDQSSGNHWLKVRLIGTVSNRDGIGALIRLSSPAGQQVRVVGSADPTYGQNALPTHFGLGDAFRADLIQVEWPSGILQSLDAVPVDQTVVIHEGTDWLEIDVPPLNDPGNTWGAAWADFDGDGDDDLYLSYDADEPNRLLRNDGGLFTEATPPQMDLLDPSQAAAWADYDNDGDQDLYLVTELTSNHLFQNDGAGAFTDVTTGALGNAGAGRACAWVDHDNDGDLDLYVVNRDEPNLLLRNDGSGGFVDVTTAPLDAPGGTTCVAWADYDDDGDLDLYLASWGEPNLLLRNDGSDQFSDVTATPLDHSGLASGVAWGDYDDDGDPDLFLANTSGQADRLYRNEGAGSFTNMSSSLPDNGGSSAGGSWIDFDNDGWLDLLVTKPQSSNQLYHNGGDGSFGLVPIGAMGELNLSTAIATADYDDDGDLDVYITDRAGPNGLFRNLSQDGQNWIQFELLGLRSNRDAIGARLELISGGRTQYRTLGADPGRRGQDSRLVHFGLGANSSVDQLIIRWPSGTTQTITQGLVVGKRHLVGESGGATGVEEPVARPLPFALHPATPNPFNPSTTLSFDLPERSEVTVTVYDVGGRRIHTVLHREWLAPGRHGVEWNGRDDDGSIVASGVYFHLLQAGTRRAHGKMLLLK